MSIRRRLNSLGVTVLGVVVGGDQGTLNHRYRYYHKAGEAEGTNADPIPLSKA